MRRAEIGLGDCAVLRHARDLLAALQTDASRLAGDERMTETSRPRRSVHRARLLTELRGLIAECEGRDTVADATDMEGTEQAESGDQ